MSQPIKQLLNKELSFKDYRYLAEEEDVYECIVQEAAQSQIRKLSQALEKKFQQAITPLLKEALAPQLEVRHVREEGLRIWGKADNVAFSKSTIVGLLEMLRVASSSDQFNTALLLAGRQAALGFFDQFRRILRVGGQTRLPKNVLPFLIVLGEFDERSGWWEGIEYDDSAADRISVTVSRPFWRFPFTDKGNHHFSDFAAGYILSLHNCCYDYLSTVSQVTDSKFDDWFALEARVFRDPDLDKCHLMLHRTRKTIAEFESINALIFILVEWLLDDITTDKHRDEIVSKLRQINEDIGKVFGESAGLDEAKLSEIQVVQQKFRPEFVRNEFTSILQQLRCRYEELRITKLKG